MTERYIPTYKNRQRFVALFGILAVSPVVAGCHTDSEPTHVAPPTVTKTVETPTPEIKGRHVPASEIIADLGTLAVKGKSPMTGYDREDQFGGDWRTIHGCTTRDTILARDLRETVIDPDTCNVVSGTLDDPYTGTELHIPGNAIDIDHIVALGDAWQTGADTDHMEQEDRRNLANDPLNLQATQASANRQKGDKDISGWEPKNKRELCRYIARQILVKVKYHLWTTPAEHTAMSDKLAGCSNQTFVIPE